MRRLLVIPAAGRGSRLGWHGPKALCPVAGRPMLDHLLERYDALVDRFVVIAAPDAQDLIRRHLEPIDDRADCVVQLQPTGMLPAVLCAMAPIEAHAPDEVWITWCDQIAIGAQTVRRLADEMDRHPEAEMIFPTVQQEPPYIHFVRDPRGRIISVRQRREGDEMPAIGESDAGLFALRLSAYVQRLVEYDRGRVEGAGTGERNFLPFIPWLAARTEVRTFAVGDAREAVGINTPADLAVIEDYLHASN